MATHFHPGSLRNSNADKHLEDDDFHAAADAAAEARSGKFGSKLRSSLRRLMGGWTSRRAVAAPAGTGETSHAVPVAIDALAPAAESGPDSIAAEAVVVTVDSGSTESVADIAPSAEAETNTVTHVPSEAPAPVAADATENEDEKPTAVSFVSAAPPAAPESTTSIGGAVEDMIAGDNEYKTTPSTPLPARSTSPLPPSPESDADAPTGEAK
jgi:hypothetical protein